MTKTVYIMCGPAGCGKSTFVDEMVKVDISNGVNFAVISRDSIRFSFISDDDDYFKYEDLVFKKFVGDIIAQLENKSIERVYVDATHLGRSSRGKLMRSIGPHCEDVRVVFYEVLVPLDVCLKQNAKREGRRRVPDEVVKNMYGAYQSPDNGEMSYYYDKYSLKSCSKAVHYE